MSGQENDIAQAEKKEARAQETENINDEIVEEEDIEEAPVDQAETNIGALQVQLEKEKEQVQASRELALRSQAEMENLRKRTVRDIENAHKYALEKFVNELLPIIDSLELGMSAFEGVDNVDNLRKGMEMTVEMFSSALEKFGIKSLVPQGEKFNPEQHEAVSMQETEGFESGTVVMVMQKGYELNGRSLRPARVVVAK